MPPTDPTNRPEHTILLPDETLARARAYLLALQGGQARAGGLLRAQLADAKLATMDPVDLLGHLFATKKPQIFAESAVAGDGSDWNLIELGLLGDVSVAVPVTVFDDGCGFSENGTTGHGLANMSERAADLGGECSIASQPGTGTTIAVNVPWPSENPQS